jgi:hypothetical protein
LTPQTDTSLRQQLTNYYNYQLPTHQIERWIFKAETRIKDSIAQLRQKTQRSTQPIQRFFHRLVQPAHQQQQNRPNAIRYPQQNEPNRNNLARRHLVSRTILSFFQRPPPPPAPDPFIPEPPNDNRPP